MPVISAKDLNLWYGDFKALKGIFMNTLFTKLGALALKGGLKGLMERVSPDTYGGAPLLGLKGLVVKTHGNSKALEVKNSIIQGVTFKEQDINGKIQESLGTAKEPQTEQ